MIRVHTLIICFGLLAGVPAGATGLELARDVFASLGGSVPSSGFRLGMVGGIPVAGTSTGSSLEILSGFWVPDPEVVADADPLPGSTLPLSTRLYQNAPNPFDPATALRFDIAPMEAAPQVDARLDVFDVSGRRIVTLVDGPLAPGSYQVIWSGTDEHGDPAASGVYFARLIAGRSSRLIRMSVVK